MGEIREELDRCAALAREGRRAEAEAVAEVLTAEQPDEGQGWVALGLLRYQRRWLFGATAALETAATLVPLDPPTRLVLAECFARTGLPALAKHVYEALAADPTLPDALLPPVAAGLGHIGEFGPALGACLELTRRDPMLPEAHFGVAFYLRKLGRSPASILPIVARAHDLAPAVPLYRVSLATLLDHVGRRDEARELLRGLDLDAVSCRGCIRRMATIFANPVEPGAAEPGPAPSA